MSISDTEDPLDWRIAAGADESLRPFNEAGVLESADLHVAQRITALAEEDNPTVVLAVALAARALRGGSVCVDLTTVATDTGVPELPWPDPATWLETLRASPLAGEPPVLRLYDNRLLYLDRYWREEEQVCADLLALSVPVAHTDVSGLDRLFPLPDYVEQRAAAEIAIAQAVTVLTGGPGTGKTHTVARLLALLAEHAGPSANAGLRIALAAPTGKAAARLTEAVAAEVGKLEGVDRERLSGLSAVTLHRLLGSRPDTSVRFRHHRGNRLPHDVIVVDETSMVSLTMMARLLEAVRPDARLILVGDADQLTSVEAGAVLADLVDGLSARSDVRVAVLHTSHRFGPSIGALAEAIRVGDADTVVALLGSGDEHVEFVEGDAATALRAILLPHALRLREAAMAGAVELALATLDQHRLLCAHRHGPFGAQHWNQQVQRWLAEETGQPAWSQWYPGRPLLVTANDYGLRVYNGDTGVAVAGPEGLRAFIAAANGPLDFATSRLADIETMHAMTIHKSQGSQAEEVTVLMPPEDSRLLTRELFYTAVTRAKTRVRVVGSEAEVRDAVARRALRASGLRQRLQAPTGQTPR